MQDNSNRYLSQYIQTISNEDFKFLVSRFIGVSSLIPLVNLNDNSLLSKGYIASDNVLCSIVEKVDTNNSLVLNKPKSLKPFKKLLLFTQAGSLEASTLPSISSFSGAFSYFTPSLLSNEILKIKKPMLSSVFSPPLKAPFYIDQSLKSYNSADIIKNIFNYLEDSFTYASDYKHESKYHTRLSEKISFNFPHNENFVKQYFVAHFSHINAVRSFVLTNFSEQEHIIKRLIFKIRYLYSELIDDVNFFNPIGDYTIFKTISNSLVPPNFASLEYHDYALAIVLFFFEYCEFGKRHNNDETSLFPDLVD